MAVAETSPTPPPVPEDPGAELDALLSDTGGEQNNTTKARILYAKAELARLRKQPVEEEKDIAQIAAFKPEDLSPVLLGRTGDYLLGKNKLQTRQKPFYDRLMQDYPKSDYADYAYNPAWAEIAYQKNDLQLALAPFH